LINNYFDFALILKHYRKRFAGLDCVYSLFWCPLHISCSAVNISPARQCTNPPPSCSYQSQIDS